MPQQPSAHDPFGRPVAGPSQPGPTASAPPPDPGVVGSSPDVVATLASRWSRLGGAIVDSLIVSVPVAFLFDALTPYSWNDDGDDWGTILALYGLAMAYVVVFFFYNVLMLTRSGEHRGQTLGKQIAGTWVASETGRPLTTGEAVKRELGRGLFGLVPLISTVDSVAIFFQRRQTLHDLIGSTVVLGAAVNKTAYACPSGWYPDPAGSDELRWWDGQTWADTTSSVPDAEAGATTTEASRVASPAAATPPAAATAPAAWATAATPAQANGDNTQPLASRGRRFVARLVDLLVVGGPLLFLWFVLAALCYDEYGYMRTEASDVLFVLGTIALAIVYVLYMTLMPARKGARNGQTWGKQLLGVRAVSATGAPLSIGTACLRELIGVELLGLVPFYAIADAIAAFCNPRRQALHDMMASTVVVAASAAPATVAFAADPYAGHVSAAPTFTPQAPASSPLATAQPAGWYPDPAASSGVRWWDGSSWTDHTQADAR